MSSARINFGGRPGTAEESQVVVFTSSFPYGRGEQFLETEAAYLVERFRRVVFVPSLVAGDARVLPDGAEIDHSLAREHARRRSRLASLRACLTSSLLYRELAARPRVLGSHVAARRAASFLVKAIRARDWLIPQLSELYPPAETIFYTYWVQPETLALAMLRERDPSLRVVSRAHGGDLYESRAAAGYLPFRTAILRGVAGLLAVSDHGRRYLSARYPRFDDKVGVARLGVKAPGFSTARSTDGRLRVVSCSFLVPVKRVDLLIAALRVVALSRPELEIEWHHLGDGPLRARLEACASATLPSQVEWRFDGHLPNREVLDFYRRRPVDVFVNVSASEGLPVSIMEAQSCGIPIVATGVGGTPEIVDDGNGILLDADPTAERVAGAVLRFAAAGDELDALRAASLESWHSRYNAARNFPAFIDQIRATCRR
jgi:colanic acid/amylovoran biosynthesis glycosyltransferase